MIAYLLQASLCSALFYLLYHFLYAKNKDHSLNRIYILSALSFSLIIPILSIPVFPEVLVLQSIDLSNATQNPYITKATSAYDWNHSIRFVYLIGVLLGLGIFIKRLIQLSLIIRNGQLDIQSDHQIIYTSSQMKLSSFGRWIISPLSKKGNLTKFELLHEKSHIARKHSIDIIAIEIYKSFFWFNPIISLYKQRITEIHEYQADHDASNQTGIETYQSFLLAQLEELHPPQLVNNFNSIFKKRLIMMNSKSIQNRWHYLYVLPLLLITMIFFSFENYPIYVDKDGIPISMERDTIIPNSTLDTMLMYNPTLNKEVKWVIVRPNNSNAYLLPNNDPSTFGMNWVDTISTIDYDTFVEEFVTINYKTGVIDTIK